MKSTIRKAVLGLAAWIIISPGFAAAQSTPHTQHEKAKKTDLACPMQNLRAHDTTPPATMHERGEKGMGFSQSATTHRFILKRDGGAIQVEAKDPADMANRDAIRQHLMHIAEAFSNGDFTIPMFVHDTTPPGVLEMKQLRGKIRYSYEETAAGGRVVIAAADEESLKAIHKFLRFQIDEHKTENPAEPR
jgi:hypothetical protein